MSRRFSQVTNYNNRLFINKLFWSLGCKDNCMKSFDCFSLFSNMFNFLEIEPWPLLSNPSPILNKCWLKVFWCFYGIQKATLTQNRWRSYYCNPFWATRKIVRFSDVFMGSQKRKVAQYGLIIRFISLI